MNVGRWAYGVGGTGLFILIGCAAPQVRLGDPQAEAAAMLARSAADWNAGDLGGLMSPYARDPLTRSFSGRHVQYLRVPLLDHYQATYFVPGQLRVSLT